MADPIIAILPLGFQWPMFDPFLFCAHHRDAYPAGNERLGPATSLTGRHIGQDFEGKDGWRMYHGQTVPGFPYHPHRGFETVTLVRRGLVDHSDSLGATARFGEGDVQWITAGRGILHAEMFPLVRRDAPNPLELFQVWLNLPSDAKLVEPHFSMYWSPHLPRCEFRDDEGRAVHATLVAGELDGHRAQTPPPNSWAASPENEVAIWLIILEPGMSWTLPPAHAASNRTLYFHAGEAIHIADRTLPAGHAFRLRAEMPVVIEAIGQPAQMVLLQGRPIGEPVVQYGPFVMNSEAEIRQAFADYHRTQFGGWPWPTPEPVHPREQCRFARYPDGHVESPPPATSPS